MTSRKDVILCRGTWYVATVLSVIGLSISLNFIWPPGKLSSRFLRDGAVSATTFYAVTLVRFFIDPPSTSYKEFNTNQKRAPQGLFSHLALSALLGSSTIIYYKCRSDNSSSCKEFGLSVSFFTLSLFNGVLGLVQLSDKLRMEIKHALYTLFLGWLFCLLGIAYGFCIYDHPAFSLAFMFLQVLLCGALFKYNSREEIVPLPT